jgi:hypothetical protein
MRRQIQSVILSAAFVVAATVPAHPQSPSKSDQDVVLGVWKVDLAQSRYYPGPPPLSETRTFTRDKGGIMGIVLRRNANGSEERIEYRADFDQEYPVSGTEAYDAVRFRRIDAYTSDAVLSHASRVFGTARRVISKDGRTMTITFRQEDPALVKNVVVYHKEP